MPRVVAQRCEKGCKMKRLYVRAEGGKGWDSIGWLCTCGCGCVKLDEGGLQTLDCCSPGVDLNG